MHKMFTVACIWLSFVYKGYILMWLTISVFQTKESLAKFWTVYLSWFDFAMEIAFHSCKNCYLMPFFVIELNLTFSINCRSAFQLPLINYKSRASIFLMWEPKCWVVHLMGVWKTKTLRKKVDDSYWLRNCPGRLWKWRPQKKKWCETNNKTHLCVV